MLKEYYEGACQYLKLYWQVYTFPLSNSANIIQGDLMGRKNNYKVQKASFLSSRMINSSIVKNGKTVLAFWPINSSSPLSNSYSSEFTNNLAVSIRNSQSTLGIWAPSSDEINGLSFPTERQPSRFGRDRFGYGEVRPVKLDKVKIYGNSATLTNNTKRIPGMRLMENTKWFNPIDDDSWQQKCLRSHLSAMAFLASIEFESRDYWQHWTSQRNLLPE